MSAINSALCVAQRHLVVRTARARRMFRTAAVVTCIASLVSLSGCDAGPDKAPSELITFFKGTWDIVGFEDDRGDITSEISNFETLQWKFRDPSGAYDLTVVSESSSIDGVITGNWTDRLDPLSPVVVMESSIPCSIQEKVQPGPCLPKIDLSYAYEFSGDEAPGDESIPAGGPDILTFTTEGETVRWLNGVFGTSMVGVVQMTLKIRGRET